MEGEFRLQLLEQLCMVLPLWLCILRYVTLREREGELFARAGVGI